MPDAPGPTPDRAVLARAEADWRATPPDLAGWVSLSRDASRALMAEYDRRGAVIAAVLAECDAREQWTQPWQTAGFSCSEIRDLLEGEER